MRGYQHVRAHPALSQVIAGFSQRQFDNAQALPVALPARTDLFLEFYLGEPYRVRRDGSTGTAPVIALVAPHTHPGTELLIQGHVDTFTVHFTPTACHRLFGCDLKALRDRAVLASDALGLSILKLHSALQAARSFTARLALAQAYFESHLVRARPADAIDLAAQVLASAQLPVRVSQLAEQAGCSERQLSRVFTQRTGLPPKLYSRLARFQALLTTHQRQPSLPLAQLAHAAHYFDQAHFIRDCREFTARSPQDFLRHWMPADRIVG